MSDFESSQESELKAREESFNIELIALKKEKADTEEKIKNLQEESEKQAAALIIVQGEGPDLQGQYNALILQRNETREKRDRMKEAMDKL